MKYFGTDGIRDKSNFFTDNKIGYKIGLSFQLFKKNKKPVYIARDTRESSLEIVQDIIKGLTDIGVDACDIGVFPTPVLAYISLKKKAYALMVTASHNPYQDNGIKLFQNGYKSDEKVESIIEDVIDDKKKITVSKDKGNIIESFDVLKYYGKLYKPFLESTDLKIVLDLANGAAVSTAEYFYNKISKNTLYLNNRPDGLNINRDCGSTHLDGLRASVLENNADLGIAYDGDADRLLAIDHKGEVVDGDFIIYLFASYLNAKNQLNNHLVALSKMCNIGIVKALSSKGINTVQTDVGDKYIMQALIKHEGVLGGENSGHIINRHVMDSGDGVLNSIFLIQVLSYYKMSLHELKNQITYYPDRLVNLKNIDKRIASDSRVIELVNKYIELLGDEGKVLVRPSGTENMIRISVSAPNEKLVNQIVQELETLILSINKEGDSK